MIPGGIASRAALATPTAFAFPDPTHQANFTGLLAGKGTTVTPAGKV